MSLAPIDQLEAIYAEKRVPLEQMADEIDIVKVIGAVVDLRQSGAGWSGHCPFCESSPEHRSLHVGATPNATVKMGWFCLRCNSAGTVIKFIEMMSAKVSRDARVAAEEAGLVWR